MVKIFPEKLKDGDTVRVITPARSLTVPWITDEIKVVAQKGFEKLGLNLTFGQHTNEIDELNSSSIASRIADLHEAFQDPSVKLIIAGVGGFNSNQLLPYLDYDLIRSNPKILCGFSDITALTNAIYAKTGLVTYSGPNYFSFGDQQSFEYSLNAFKDCLFSNDTFALKPSEVWSDDNWANDQEHRTFLTNDGYWIINEGKVNGTLIGGNQCTLNLLQGTEYMPILENSILFLEDDYETHPATIDRDLQSLIHQSDFGGVKGIVFGRFQTKTGMTKELLTKIIQSKAELKNVPVIANVDFGHTTPLITFPIGGIVKMEATAEQASIMMLEH